MTNKNKLSILIIACFVLILTINFFPLWEINTGFMGKYGLSGFNIVFGGGDLGEISDMAESFGVKGADYSDISNIILFIPVILGFILSLIMDGNKKKYYIISLIALIISCNMLAGMTNALDSIANTTGWMIVISIVHVIGFVISIYGIVKTGKKSDKSKKVVVKQMESGIAENYQSGGNNMTFLDDISKKIEKTSQGAVQRTKEFAEIARLKSRISDLEGKIATTYKELGQTCFLKEQSNENSPYAEYFNNIKLSLEEIQKLNDTIRKIKGDTLCPNCGSVVKANAIFCANCGGKLIELNSVPAEESRDIECKKCGAKLKADDKFCINCGTKNE